MDYSQQLISEAVMGRHNITDWVREEIATIKQSDINLALSHAKAFLTQERDDLDSKARIEELLLLYTLEDASQLIVDSLLSAIILIKPEILVRGGVDTIFHGVAPMQAIATQIGLPLHYNQLDAVQTGIELLAHFEHLGIYNVRVVKEENRSANQGTHIEVHGDSAVVIPCMTVSLQLYSKIQATRYLPPMLVKPLEY